MFSLKHTTSVQGVPDPLGKYSNSVSVPPGGTMYIAGQVGFGPDGVDDSAPDLETQTRRALENIEGVLRAGSLGPEHLTKLTTFVVDVPLAGFASARDEIFARWFPNGNYPAHSLAIVKALVRPELLVEIEGVAAIPTSQ